MIRGTSASSKPGIPNVNRNAFVRVVLNNRKLDFAIAVEYNNIRQSQGS